jgi:HK97 family phage portal protein
MKLPSLGTALGGVIRWAKGTNRWFGSLFTGGGSFNYRRAAGDLGLSSIVVPCVKWIQRTFPEAKFTVYQYETIDGKEVKKPIRGHRLAKLLEKPNKFYSGLHLWAGTIADFEVSGNAYWLLGKNRDGSVQSIWWVPSFMMEPAWPDDDPTIFISHYVYTVDGIPSDIPVENVVHFRDGFDPRNIRKGLSSLAGMIREIATDNEASEWTYALLANMGVPGVIVSPAPKYEIAEEDAEEIKEKFSTNFTGGNRGKPMVLSGPIQVQNVAFSPEQMNVTATRRIPEERASAAIGVPAVVVGLGAGLDRSTFNNMAEAREAAYESCLIPIYRLFAAEVQGQLVPQFGDENTMFVEFDLSEVRVLQEDVNKLHQRVREDVKSGIISLNEGRMKLNEPPIAQDVWYITRTVTIVDLPEPTQLALPEPGNVVPISAREERTGT